jgi:phosphate uptake regulator
VLVGQALNDISEMILTGGRMLAAACGHLLDNEILDVDLQALDETINEREADLRRALLEHLSLNPRKDLVFSLKLLSIVQEAERIGDLAKSLSEAAALARAPRMGASMLPLRRSRDRIIDMVGRVNACLTEDDEAEAVLLMKEHEQVKADLSEYLVALASEDHAGQNAAVVLALGARMLSRVSSHIANIASTVASPFDQIRGTPVFVLPTTPQPSFTSQKS